MIQPLNINIIPEDISFIPKVISKRLKIEIGTALCKYDEITFECLEKEYVKITFKRKNNTYIFSIPSSYPFLPPKLTINGIGQQAFFNLASGRFSNILKQISGIDCLCCDSYLCINNWSVSRNMNQVIEQIEKYKTIKYLIFVKILLEKIKEKYLHIWIDLDSWFFSTHLH